MVTPNKFSVSHPPLRHIGMQAGSPFPLAVNIYIVTVYITYALPYGYAPANIMPHPHYQAPRWRFDIASCPHPGGN